MPQKNRKTPQWVFCNGLFHQSARSCHMCRHSGLPRLGASQTQHSPPEDVRLDYLLSQKTKPRFRGTFFVSNAYVSSRAAARLGPELLPPTPHSTEEGASEFRRPSSLREEAPQSKLHFTNWAVDTVAATSDQSGFVADSNYTLTAR